MKQEKKVTSIRLSVELIKKLKDQAEKEGRSFNNLVERKLQQA
jgi:predicted HicB family RNase H-like nuclease